MKQHFAKLFIVLIIALVYVAKPQQVFAQYGTYGCFGSGASGVCRPRTANNCINGGVVPNPTQCDGLSPATCNSTAFPCEAPGSCQIQGQPCSSINRCCLGLNCIDSLCVDSSPDELSDVITCTGSCSLLPCLFGPGEGGCVLSQINCCANHPPWVVSEQESGPPIEDGKIDTGIGKISVENEQSLALFLLGWGMGLGGGIALILIVISTYLIITSAGDPRKLQAGKEFLYSALTGLGLLISAAYLLKLIGVDILGILSA